MKAELEMLGKSAIDHMTCYTEGIACLLSIISEVMKNQEQTIVTLTEEISKQ